MNNMRNRRFASAINASPQKFQNLLSACILKQRALKFFSQGESLND